MKLKNKVLAAVLSGAMIFGSGLAVNSVKADPLEDEDEQYQELYEQEPEFAGRHGHPQMDEEQINEVAKDIADHYGLEQSEIADALRNHAHFSDVRHAVMLSKISGKSFSEVMAMKADWFQVAKQLGVTREQFEAFMKDEFLTELAERSKLDKKTVESFLNDRYHPHDIKMAGIIANASGKSVKKVMAKRQINNTWDDVAKDFGVDLKQLMKPQHEPRH